MRHWKLAGFLLVAGVTRAAEVPVFPPDTLRAPAPRSPEEALAGFELDPEFRIELVAAEPLVASPVAMAFDEDGVLYVCEMRDYSERRADRLGRISRLEDRDGDGRMDHVTRFVEDLPWPTGVLCYGGGVFVLAAPDLWFCQDTNGDGVADLRRVVLTGFSELATRLNVQQLPNSLRWGPDQRVHLAEGGNGSRVRRPEEPAGAGLVLRGRDLSFDPRTFQARAESGGGQYGMAFDNAGRKFVCSNSRHLMQIAYDLSLVGEAPAGLPSPAVDIAADGPAAPVFRRSPDEAWRVIRTRWRVSGIAPGLIEGGGSPSGYFTGATGLQIARGDRMRATPAGDDEGSEVFIADTGSNLVHRKRVWLEGVLLRGERPDPNERREFLASTDNWFRPVQLENGPSGGLYVVDFYREIIEHPWSLPPGIKEHLDLNRGNDRGRIWRIVGKTASARRAVRLRDAGSAELVALLGHANGWHRDTAARLLSERQDPAVAPMLKSATHATSVHARLGALSLLRARDELDAAVLSAALEDPEPTVRRRALQAGTGLTWLDWSEPPWRSQAVKLAADTDAEVRFIFTLCLARTAPDHELVRVVWPLLAGRFQGDRWLRAAAVQLVAPHAREVYEVLAGGAGPFADTGFRVAVAALAARKAGADVAQRWLIDAAHAAAGGGEPATSRLLQLAAGLAHTTEFRSPNPVPAVVGPPLCEAALRLLQSLPARPVREEYDWLTDALTLADAKALQGVVLAGLTTLTNAVARDLAAEALIVKNDGELRTGLLGMWTVLSPRVRSQLLELAGRDATWLAELLRAAADDPVFRGQLGPKFRTLAREHQDPAIRATALDLFGAATAGGFEERRRFFAPALELSGDATRGRGIYQLRCASCHRAAGEGFAVGPDLLTVAAAGRESILANLLDPHREVAPRYEAWRARLTDGEEVTGLLVDERHDAVTLRAGSGVDQRLARDAIAALVSTGQSLMPAGLDDGLAPGEMADLLRFIEALVEPGR